MNIIIFVCLYVYTYVQHIIVRFLRLFSVFNYLEFYDFVIDEASAKARTISAHESSTYNLIFRYTSAFSQTLDHGNRMN